MAAANALDRVIMHVAPRWGLSRIIARAQADVIGRHYEAASAGRRTQNWPRRLSDANTAAAPALSMLHAQSRDLVRNNPWARNAVRIIPRNVVGWGISSKPLRVSPAVTDAWRRWTASTDCDSSGRMTFTGLQKLVMRGVVEGGEMLIRRRWRRPSDGLALPLQMQVLEPEFLDTSKTNVPGQEGGTIQYGIEFDAIDRRVAYWLFDEHPGSSLRANPVSRRIPASEILHVYDLERAGQDRGVPWLAAAILTLRDFDEFEDAQLLRQKIAACFAAFVSEPEGIGPGIGEQSATDPLVETLEPGIISYMKPGREVTFGSPPQTTDDGFSVRTLRRIAAALGVTYEDLVGDYSQVNFSSARMSRLAHWANVYDWQWNMLIPQFCDQVWRWAMDGAVFGGLASTSEIEKAGVEWSPQPMPLTEPDKEARANVLMVRSGQKSLSQVIREQGADPDALLGELAGDMKKLDQLGLVLDSDPRRVTQTGQAQAAPAAPGEKPAPPSAKPEDDGAGDDASEEKSGGT